MRGKHIIVAVSAGIAAYKAIEVVSRLRKKGAEVKVVMTQNATYIASPLTFGEISGHPVALDMFEQVHQWDVEHIALATWADAYVVVPTTANVIGKIYAGIADDMLTTTIMATTAPKYLCPAMNTEMYNNPITQRNLEGLRSLGYHIMDPAEGWLACGITGVGRLPEPEAIVDWLEAKMCSTNELEGTTILVTAGGTQESIDPVRYIGNRSSGKMGYAIAEQAAHMGAKVILVSAPTSLPIPSGVDFISVDSAVSMQEAVEARYNDVNVVIMAAAVSDFRVLLQGLGSKKSHQILVGFAAETEHVIKYGQDKVAKKNLDMLVANDVSKSNAGFNVDTNEGYFLYPDKEPKEMPNMKKSDLARHILREVIDLVANKHS
ncbi:MAG: bifunctional phosphopantothenoylcysteine decarboxylase/phosphopantothenate--cysteine ligase CoaBC [Veillonella sp.]|nr:bifunctional phosphopantothenoylcysteine decarboxylase/phosphopantothenate--cysteine ligase CoaBC [Veillonella sp.]